MRETILTIKSDEEFQRAVKVVEYYIDNPPPDGDPSNEQIDHLIGLINDYQNKHYQIIDKTDEVDALLFLMDQKGLMPNDLVPSLGGIEIVNEVLSRRRKLSATMIGRLIEEFGSLAADVFSDVECLESKHEPFEKIFLRKKVLVLSEPEFKAVDELLKSEMDDEERQGRERLEKVSKHFGFE